MSLGTDELLQRMAETLRQDIGPAVGEPFAKTQAFMASVILGKLAGQLRAAPDDARADEAEHVAVAAAVRTMLAGATCSDRLAAAVAALDIDGAATTWSELVAATYEGRDELGPARFEAVLTEIRRTLRTRLDRALVYAR